MPTETLTGPVAYTIATGRMFCSMADLQAEAERLLDGPIFTHEFADKELWERVREALEVELIAEAKATWAR